MTDVDVVDVWDNLANMTPHNDTRDGRPVPGSSVFGNLVQVIATLTVLGVFILAAVVGNVFVIAAVVLERNLHNVANYLVASLATADLMVATLVMPLAALNEVSERWFLGKSVCDMWVSFDVVCCTASILHLVAISMDRYWAVTRVDYIRNRSARRILIMIALSWGLALSICLPPLFIQSDPNYDPNATGECFISQNLGYTVYSTVGAFYLPFLFMMIIYFKVFLVARERIRKKRFRESRRFVKRANHVAYLPPQLPQESQEPVAVREELPEPAVTVTRELPDHVAKQRELQDALTMPPESLASLTSPHQHRPSPLQAATSALTASSAATLRSLTESEDPIQNHTGGFGHIDRHLGYSIVEGDNEAEIQDGSDVNEEEDGRMHLQNGGLILRGKKATFVPAPEIVNHEMLIETGSESELPNFRIIPNINSQRFGDGTQLDALQSDTVNFKTAAPVTQSSGPRTSTATTTSATLLSMSATTTVTTTSVTLSSISAATTVTTTTTNATSIPTQNSSSKNRAILFAIPGASDSDVASRLSGPQPSRSTSEIQLTVPAATPSLPGSIAVDNQNLKGSWLELAKQHLERRKVSKTPSGGCGQSSMSKRHKAKEKAEVRRERKAARTLAIITGSFCLCWLPFFIVAIVRPFCGESCHYPVLLLSVINWLGYMNSLLNPIIYTIFNPDFRLAFANILFGKYRRQKKYRRSAANGSAGKK